MKKLIKILSATLAIVLSLSITSLIFAKKNPENDPTISVTEEQKNKTEISTNDSNVGKEFTRKDLPIDNNTVLYDHLNIKPTWHWPWEGIEKEVTKNYTYYDVPSSIEYSEYIDGKWYSGTLNRIGKVERIKDLDIWQGTYKGKIYKN